MLRFKGMWRSLKNLGHLLEAVLANLIYGFPSRRLKVLCITGTDGKTTTATLLYQMLKTAGKNVALISTVAAFIGDSEIDTGFHVTNPSSFALQRLLRRIVKAKMEYVVLEITSHGIDQNRNWGIHPEISGITNVTHEHLDYHKTFERYLATKAKLLTDSEFAVLNSDAKDSFESLVHIVKRSGVPFSIVSVKTLSSRLKRVAKKRFGEESYNFENVAVAVGIAHQLGIGDEAITTAIKSFAGVKGRMEEIENDRKLKLIVDFAHTPNALERALITVREKMNKQKQAGRLIVVFGCAGLRDIDKRPLMGGIAAKLTDMAVFTAEDPRTEDVWTIINQMKSGVVIGHDKIVSIADRFKAIEFAINKLAMEGDTILITGKGHERSMNIEGKELDYSDQEAIKKILVGETHF